MPYEVRPISGPDLRRSAVDVCNDIKAFYERIAEKSGTVLAGHAMAATVNESINEPMPSVLYLVAEVPDAVPHTNISDALG